MNREALSASAQTKLLTAGYTLIPLRGKIPITKGWQSAPQDPDFKTTGNYGVVLHEEDLVIDCDVRNYPKGRDVLAELIKDTDGLKTWFDTFAVKTGGGGFHFYLKKPADFPVKEQIPEYPGIEFKSNKRQVVGPFSVHPDTKKDYKVVHGYISKVKQAPEKILQMIKNHVQEREARGTKVEYHDDEMNIKAFMNYLRDDAPLAIIGQGGDKTTYAVAARGKDLGLSPDLTYSTMLTYWNGQCDPPWENEELRIKVQNAYRYGQDTVGSRSTRNYFDTRSEDEILPDWDFKARGGGLSPHVVNVVNFFLHPEFGDKSKNPLFDLLAYNGFTGAVEYKRCPPWHKVGSRKDLIWEPTELTDNDFVEVSYWMVRNHGFEVTERVLKNGVVKAALRNTFHPVRDWLTSLEWDGTKRLTRWLTTYCGVKGSPYTRAVGAKTLLGAVSRAFHPGIKFDTMLVLEGEQGVGKSTVVEILGGDWYADVDIKMRGKDTIQAIRGKWFIEESEMKCVRHTDVNALKSFLSRSTDRTRMPYASSTEDFPRQSIIVGTINPDGVGYLKDDTGNRRYWPVWCANCRTTMLRRDRDQIFAEAVVRYRKGEKIYLEEMELHQAALVEADARKLADPWRPLIRNYLRDYQVTETELYDLYLDVIGGSRSSLGIRELSRLTECLRVLGWERKGHYLWVKPDIELDRLMESF